MSAPNTTPGPWRVRENARNTQEECDLTICGDIWQLADINGPQYSHQIANAHLIAAAPCLYDALERLTQFVDETCAYVEADPLIEAARAALSRARGEVAK